MQFLPIIAIEVLEFHHIGEKRLDHQVIMATANGRQSYYVMHRLLNLVADGSPPVPAKLPQNVRIFGSPDHNARGTA
jgi:hypothetical protein